jgi:hypothetical protein
LGNVKAAKIQPSNISMTLEELQANLADINHLLEKYYAENIVMIEGDGTVTTGKEACRQGRDFFFREMLLSSENQN